MNYLIKGSCFVNVKDIMIKAKATVGDESEVFDFNFDNIHLFNIGVLVADNLA